MTQPHFPVLAYVSHSVSARGKVDNHDIPGLFGQLVGVRSTEGQAKNQFVLLFDLRPSVSDVEGKIELLVHFVSPLFTQRSRAQNEDTFR